MAYETRKAQYKVDAVSAMKGEFSEYDGFIFTDYRGMTVEQITNLRSELRKNESAYRVVKNRFAKIVLADLNQEGYEDKLIGPTAVALTKGEDASNAVSKAIVAFAKDAPIEVKGAILNGQLYDAEALIAYSKLPTRLELIASLMGTMNAPMNKLARTLQAMVDAQTEAE